MLPAVARREAGAAKRRSFADRSPYIEVKDAQYFEFIVRSSEGPPA
jgi:hypothetical protein